MIMKFGGVFIVALLCHSALGRFCNHTRLNSTEVKYAESEDGESNLGRIYQGQMTYPGQFEYMAFLKIYTLRLNRLCKFICGGTIIARNWILTAAHCVDISQNVVVEVYIGLDNVEGADAVYTLGRNKIVKHPGWNYAHKGHDLALLSTPQIENCFAIGWIKMPSPDFEVPTDGSVQGIVSGWGDIGNTQSNGIALYWTTVSIVDNSFCEEFEPDDNEICTSSQWPNGSPCEGDSGGPLVLNGQLIGVLSSNGLRGCESEGPSIFMKITAYYPWLTEVTGIVFN